jgi:hypothetical protein
VNFLFHSAAANSSWSADLQGGEEVHVGKDVLSGGVASGRLGPLGGVIRVEGCTVAPAEVAAFKVAGAFEAEDAPAEAGASGTKVAPVDAGALVDEVAPEQAGALDTEVAPERAGALNS